MYMLRRLVDVDLKNSVEAVDDVVAKLRPLRASWEKIAKGDVSPQAPGAGPTAPEKVSATA
jgi:flagellin-specific chaperone FliS